MNININVNERSGVVHTKAEDSFENTSVVSDTGPSRASSEISGSNGDNLDNTTEMSSSEVEDLDIGGPPEWLSKSIADSSEDEESIADATDTEDINDGGDGPSE